MVWDLFSLSGHRFLAWQARPAFCCCTIGMRTLSITRIKSLSQLPQRPLEKLRSPAHFHSSQRVLPASASSLIAEGASRPRKSFPSACMCFERPPRGGLSFCASRWIRNPDHLVMQGHFGVFPAAVLFRSAGIGHKIRRQMRIERGDRGLIGRHRAKTDKAVGPHQKRAPVRQARFGSIERCMRRIDN